MFVPRRLRTMTIAAGLTIVTCLAASQTALAEDGPAALTASHTCVQPGPTLRYLVVFPAGTRTDDANQHIADACGAITTYYPEIAVGVATSPDPDFATVLTLGKAYSAQSADPVTSDTGQQRIQSGSTRTSQVDPADRSGEQWDMDLIKATAAHHITLGSPSVIVGVLDSGIDPTHPDLTSAVDRSLSAGCLTGKPDQDISAWQATTSPHGTHVAGIIAAADDGKGITGVAPGVRLASIKVVDDGGHIYPEYAVCGLMWAASHHMTIANNSYFVDPWESVCKDKPDQAIVYTALRRAMDYANANGVVNIVAATNAGADLTAQSAAGAHCAVLPAGLPGVVTVSSVGAAQVKAGTSSYGLGAIEVTAPGGDQHQLSTVSPQGCVLSTVPGGYGYLCGTSMAAPHASGVAALLASTHAGASRSQLMALLNQQATPLQCPSDYDVNNTGVQDAYCSGYTSYNGFYGHGLVNALAAVSEK